METKRIPLSTVLATRDSSITKDGLLTNCYTEKGPDGIRVVKRPGMSLRATIGGEDCPGQGAFFFLGGPVFIVCDTLVTDLGDVPPPPPPPENCDPAIWTLQDASDPNVWVAVTFGLGIFVAVANRGGLDDDIAHLVMTSPDGFTWTERVTDTTAGVPDEWNDVCFGGTRFVAVAENGGAGRVMFSDDGIVWEYPTSAFSTQTQWRGVAFGDGRFVAVGLKNSGVDTMFSDDGEIWVTLDSSVDASTAWNDICFDNGTFVAVGNSDIAGTIVRHSGNGVTWTGATIGVPDNVWQAVAFGAGLFVAVASTGVGNRIMTSPDAVAWTARPAPVDEPWHGITFAEGVFVVVGDTSSPVILVSNDGINWETRDVPSFQDWRDVAFGNGVFTAVSTNRNLGLTTPLQKVMTSVC